MKDAEGQTEQPSFLLSRGQVKMEKDSPGSSKHAKVKLEPRKGQKHEPSCLELSTAAAGDSFRQGAQGYGQHD